MVKISGKDFGLGIKITCHVINLVGGLHSAGRNFLIIQMGLISIFPEINRFVVGWK